MFAIANFVRGINPFSSRADASTQPLISSPSQTSAEPKQTTHKGKKRDYDDIVPSIEVDDSEFFNTGTNARKKRVTRKGGRAHARSLNELAIRERSRRRSHSDQEVDATFDDNVALQNHGEMMDEDEWSGQAFVTEGDDEEDEEEDEIGQEDAEEDDEGEVEDDGEESELGDWSDESYFGDEEVKEEDEEEDSGSGSNIVLSDPQDQSIYSGSSTGRPSPSSPSQATPLREGYSRKRPNWCSPQSVATEKARREEVAATTTAGWSQADSKLYRTLLLRGLQPILSTSWMEDFPTLPLALFTKDDEKIVVTALGLRNFDTRHANGARALNDLMKVGQYIRERISDPSRTSAETCMIKAIDRYWRWTLQDADIWRRRAYLPLMVAVSAPKSTSPGVLQNQMVIKLQKLKRKWMHALDGAADSSLPPLYGFMVCHSIAAIVAPQSLREFGEDLDGENSNLKDSIRILAIVDWKDAGQDVWNTLALAIWGVHCRDLLLEALDGRELRDVKVKGANDGDPDA